MSESGAFRIRPAVRADAATIAVLATQLGYPSTPEAAEARLAALAGDPTELVLVAEDSGSGVVGWAHATILSTLDSDPKCELAGLVVDEAHRGRGVGERLVAEVEEWARARKVARLRVHTNVVRERAQRFYRRVGFTERKRQVVLEREI